MSRPNSRRVTMVCRRLSRVYPLTRLGNKQRPLDEYLYILLSLRTHRRGFNAAYRRFKKRFATWERAYAADVRAIASAIAPAGLALQKARHIKCALRLIKREFAEVSLKRLSRLGEKETEEALLMLPGVGLKSAKCIMMYSLGFDVLPVDTHVARIAKRLGWFNSETGTVLHQQLESVVPKHLRFAFHVYCVQHGRAVCRGAHPRCRACCLDEMCPKIGLAPAGPIYATRRSTAQHSP
jgi:endonuclease-3